MTTDFILTAGIDFTGAKQQVDKFVAETERKLERPAKRFSDIMAQANRPGGSNSRPGSSGGSNAGRNAVDIARQALANEKAYQAALTRTESMVQRIGRQMDGNAGMTNRARAALSTYNSTLQTFGARSMEGAKAQGEFARSMNTLNHEIARTNGLLPTLNRGFGGVISALGTLSPTAGSAVHSVSTVATGLRAAGVAAGAAVGIVGGVALGFTALSVAALAAGAAMARPVDAMNLLIGKLNASSGSMESAKVLYADTVAIANRLGEPPRVSRRPTWLSHAAMATSSI